MTDKARNYVRGEARADIIDSHALALDDVAAGRPVDVSPILAESAALDKLYQQVLFSPETVSAKSPQVRLAYAELAEQLDVGLGDIFVDAGDYDLSPTGQVSVRSRFGMFKFIWQHGEKSSKKAAHQITKADITAFPAILREYEPRANEQGGYQWIVEIDDGRNILYVAKNFTDVSHADFDGRSHVVTIHRLTKGQVGKNGGYSKKIPGLASSARGFGPLSEIPQGELTNSGASAKPAEAVSRPSLGQDRSISTDSGNITTITGKVNRFATEAPETFTLAPELSTVERGILEESGIDPNTFTSPEELLVRQEMEAGRVSPEDAALLAEADAALARTAQMEEAGLSVLGCVLEVIE